MTVQKGDVIKIEVAESKASEYVLGDVTPTGLTKNDDGTYTVGTISSDSPPALAITLLKKYSITAGDNVSFTVNGTAAAYALKGDEVKVTAAKDGYSLSKLTYSYLNNDKTTETYITDTQSFTMPAADVTISAEFVESSKLIAGSSDCSLILSAPENVDVGEEFIVKVKLASADGDKYAASLKTQVWYDDSLVDYLGYQTPDGAPSDMTATATNSVTTTGKYVNVVAYGSPQKLAADGTAFVELRFRARSAASEQTLTFTPDSTAAGAAVNAYEVENVSGSALKVAVNEELYSLRVSTYDMGWELVSLDGDTSKSATIDAASDYGYNTIAENLKKGTAVVIKAKKDGYRMKKLLVSGGTNSLDYEYLGDSTFSFSMPAGNVALYASDSKVVSVTAKDCENGILSISYDESEPSVGDTITVTAKPDEDYVLSSISYSHDGGSTWTKISDISGNEGTFICEGDALVTAEFSEAEILTISTADDLKAFADRVNGGDSMNGIVVKLAADIDLAGIEGWTGIGTEDTPFSGTFNGCGYEISGLDMSLADVKISSGYAYRGGVFNYLLNAEVKNLTVRGTISGADEASSDSNPVYCGAVAGSALNSTITGCTSVVDMSGYLNAGGIAGYAESSTIEDCINYGNLSLVGSESGGGIAVSAGKVINCGNYGSITKETEAQESYDAKTGTTSTVYSMRGYAGGIAGQIYESAEGCFNKGSINGDFLRAGGICGVINEYGRTDSSYIKDCYSTASVALVHESTSKGDVVSMGDIAGYCGGSGVTVTNCYSTGTATVKGSAAQVVNLNSSVEEGSGTYTNCYSADATAGLTAQTLGDAFKDDSGSQSINAGLPILKWESADSFGDDKHSVTFDVSPEGVDYTLKVYTDTAMENEADAADSGYMLQGGTYFYSVSASGYITETGSFAVTIRDTSVSVTLREKAGVTFNVSPKDATFVIEDDSGNAIAPVSSDNGKYVYELYSGDHYTYTSYADGYNSTMREFYAADGDVTAVTLSSTDRPSSGGESADKYIYGDGNTGKTHVITAGGTYYIGDGATGVMTISTTEPVILVGSGTADSSRYDDLYIDCSGQATDLTLKDVYISNTSGTTNTINFANKSKDNYLYFAGTSILDQNTGATGYAMIHVPSTAGITVAGVSDDDTLYFYKREQGAGIGGNGGAKGSEGQEPEYNGDITINGGNLFMKNSKQGALIGSGANASSTTYEPGDITINGGTLNLIAISRGAAIGGSAGTTGAASGTDVYINGGTINIDIDYTGAAIGGGGFDASDTSSYVDGKANDSNGGTMHYNGGSVRTYICLNSASGWGFDTEGVHDNVAITADKVNGSGDAVYLCVLDTSELGSSKSQYTVKDDGSLIYEGGLHEYAYINKSLLKESQKSIDYTIDNWVSLDDSNLYLYLTGEDHTLTVNGKTVSVAWDAETETFTLTYPSGKTSSGSSGSGTSGGTNTSKSDLPQIDVDSTTTVDGDTATVKPDADSLADGIESASSSNKLVITADESVLSGKDVDKITTEIPLADVKSAADAGTSIEADTPLGNVLLDNNALYDLGTRDGSALTVTVEKNDDGTTGITLAIDGETVDSVDGDVYVNIPADDGNVAALVNSDGTQTLLQKSVVENGKAYVKLSGSATVKILDNSKAFDDVADGSWYKDYVDFASSHELLTGVADRQFAPDSTLTRAMLVTVLYRLEGSPAITAGSSFSDVEAGSWYEAAVAWAAENQIVLGYGDGTFGPNDAITREQLAAVLQRYAGTQGLSTSASGDLSGFTDGADTSSWAVDGLSWAVSNNIVTGKGSGVLDPAGTSTRAEAAAMLQRLIRLMVM